jgi:hypothetical protein
VNLSMFALLLAIPALAAAGAANAIDVSKLQVGEQGRRYVVEFEAQLAAPPAAVMRVLLDFTHYPELDPRICATASRSCSRACVVASGRCSAGRWTDMNSWMCRRGGWSRLRSRARAT